MDGARHRRRGRRPGAQGRVPVSRRRRGDEAAGLRVWDGNRAVRLHAACQSESAYALLLERCMPGTPLGQLLPEPEQDVVVAALLRRCAQPHGPYPFRLLAQMCAAWAEEFEAGIRGRAASGPDRSRPGAGRDRAVPGAARDRGQPCAAGHRSARRQHPGRLPGAMAGHRPQAVCRRPCLRRPAAHAQLRRPAGRRPGRAGGPDGGPGSGSTPAGYACGYSPVPCRSPPARRCCAR